VVSGRNIVSAIAYRVAEVDQYLIERGGGLMPLDLLDAVGGRSFAGPQFVQWRDLRSQFL
jgi:hypothetical protein